MSTSVERALKLQDCDIVLICTGERLPLWWLGTNPAGFWAAAGDDNSRPTFLRWQDEESEADPNDERAIRWRAELRKEGD